VGAAIKYAYVVIKFFVTTVENLKVIVIMSAVKIVLINIFKKIINVKIVINLLGIYYFIIIILL
jgi:hypothetical protein